MLFDRKHKKKVQMIWKIMVIAIIISMILLYSPLFTT